MTENFCEMFSKTLTDSEHNVSVTENGAVGFKTTGKKLVDLNFAVSSLRSASERDIALRFAEACAEDLDTAIVWLFFARDCRHGQGERRLFRVCMRHLAAEHPEKAHRVLPLVAEYGRWDDLIDLCDTAIRKDVFEIVKKQLVADMRNLREEKPVSLLGKWMPSLNATSQATKQKGAALCSALCLTPRGYRKMLSALRRQIDVVERKMSSGEWDGIRYEAVPSRANLVYNKAFLRHDEERRREYLDKLSAGETKINASVLFPHDIVHQYADGWIGSLRASDPALEALWKALPNTVEGGEGTIVVADGSGSMYSNIGKSNVMAIEVANALALYFAERLPDPYRDKYITFSNRPQFVNLAGATTLVGKLGIMKKHNEATNTNIEAVFDLILQTAVRHHLPQEKLPKNILIVSDMEFDCCSTSNAYTDLGWSRGGVDQRLFQSIASRYAAQGYRLPRLVFWNVNSRTETIPVKENGLGVSLVSGFSPNVAKMVMSGTLDPYDCLLETLNGERYQPVRDALKDEKEGA